MRPLLEIAHVSKFFRHPWTYRRIHAVKDLSLQIQPGEVFGLIGHNGAGKTTTFKMLAGLLRPNPGRLLLDGVPLDRPAMREGIGFSPEQPYFYDYLTVAETFRFYAQLYGLRGRQRQIRITELVERFRLGSKLDAAMRTLSKGNLQRVAVLQAILHRPRLAILDEPMSGLDPVGRKEMRELIQSLKNDGTSVLFSSHVLSDAEALCDRVAILAEGRLRETLSINEHDVPPLGYTLALRDPPAELLDTLRTFSEARREGGPARWTITLPDQASAQRALVEALRHRAIVEALAPIRPTLEDRFLRSMPGGGPNG